MKNEKGISLIALIITIIVIIILAAIVIGSVLNAPDQANFAKYCQDYSEIQSAVSTQASLIYGELAVSSTVKYAEGSAKLSMPTVRKYVCTTSNSTYTTSIGAEGTVTLPSVTEGTDLVPIAATNMLGLSSLPGYVTWYVECNTGTLYSSPFIYGEEEGGYNTPAGHTTETFAGDLTKK